MKSILFVLLISNLLQAQIVSVDTSRIQNEQIKKMSLQDQWVFQFVTHICAGNKLQVFQESLTHSFKAGYDLWTLDTTRFQKFYGRRFTGQNAEVIFSSLALPYALHHCFQDLPVEQQESARNRFVVEFLVMDFIGNTLGLAGGTVGISKLFGAVFSSLNKVAWAPLKNQMQKRWKLTDDQFKWLDRTIVYGALIGVVGYSAHHKHKMNQENKKEDNFFYETQIKNLVEINEMLNNIKHLIEQSEEKEFWESAFNKMDQQKKQLCELLIKHENSLSLKFKSILSTCEAS